MAVEIEKVEIIATYFAEQIPKLNVTKLMKLFYYVDFISYAERGASVTGDSYYKLPYGPVPTFIKDQINDLSTNDQLDGYTSPLKKYLILEVVSEGKFKTILVKNRVKSNLSNLSEYEQSLVKKITQRFMKDTARSLTAKTHKEKPYLLTPDNSIIDYCLAPLLQPEKIL